MLKSTVKTLIGRYEIRIAVLFLLLLVLYLGIACSVYAKRDYYGADGKPRFSDPWLKRSAGLLEGGVLYRDIKTTTPPLTNYLIVIPSLIASFANNEDPWTTLSFMLFFSLFCLFGAYVLFYLGQTPEEGWRAAVLFLLNPLTLGSAVLRRQDESILVFFVGLALMLMIRGKHIKGAVAIGVAMLIKLGAVVLIPIAFIHKRNWKYLIVPFLVCLGVFLPFLLLSGRSAMIWSTAERHNEHLFQFGGIGLIHMYNAMNNAIVVNIDIASWLLVAGIIPMLFLVGWKRFGVLEDIALLLTTALLLSPKLHTGYFCLLAFIFAPLLRKKWMIACYLAFGLLAMIADYSKFPVRNYTMTFYLLVVVAGLLVALVTGFVWPSVREKVEGKA